MVVRMDATKYDHIIHNLPPASTHRYQIRAENSVGEGPGRIVEFTVADVPDRPAISTIKEGVHNVTLAWSAPSSDGGAPISTYVIYRSEGGGAFKVIALVPASVRSLLDAGLTANVTYRYYVAAMNVMGTGAISDVAQATVLPMLSPDTGHSPVAKNWAGTYQGALVLSGTAAVGIFCTIMLYYLYRQKGGNGIMDWWRRRSK